MSDLKKETRKNAHDVVLRYLKKLQLQGKIPNPYKLPYADHLYKQAINLPKSLVFLPGSTTSAALEASYDLEYIETIIKPEVEYLLNEKHPLDKLSDIVNNRGPYKVTIRSTSAGLMVAPFLRVPNYDKMKMKELAMDIKKLMRAVRKQTIWNHSKDSKTTVSEVPHGEGFSVRGSRGFSLDEVMYPREYYEELATQEANWESLIQLEEYKSTGKNIDLTTSRAQDGLRKTHRTNLKSWISALVEATEAIDAEIRLYYKKYEIKADSPVWKKQQELQELMDRRHEKLVAGYIGLLKQLETDRVFMHSELFNGNNPVQTGYEDMIAHDSRRAEKNRLGLAEQERTGLGKKLGDYLEQFCHRGYKMGYRFAKRLNVI